jgi:pimeloyl-ACP methyl ester carboxylesterase
MSATPAPTLQTGTVSSRDGTTIGYRRFGTGPGVILLHGGMQSGQSFTKLAAALSGVFTVYLPDRRGRGMSGPFTDDHGIATEVEDLQALLRATGARNVFGLSAGAVIALQTALSGPEITRLALYEPPLSFDGVSSTRWVARNANSTAASWHRRSSASSRGPLTREASGSYPGSSWSR